MVIDLTTVGLWSCELRFCSEEAPSVAARGDGQLLAARVRFAFGFSEFRFGSGPARVGGNLDGHHLQVVLGLWRASPVGVPQPSRTQPRTGP